MKCINCATEMVILNSPVEVDECPQCDAHWFDQGELTALMKTRGVTFNEKNLKRSLKVPTKCRWCETLHRDGTVECSLCENPLGHSCPRDGRPMLHTALGSLEFDFCPECEGIWFDGDELRQLAKRMIPVKGESPPALVTASQSGVASFHQHADAEIEVDDRDFRVPRVSPDELQPCQVCGTKVPEQELGWHASLYKCQNCLVPQTTKDAERMARLRKKNLEYWRMLETPDFILTYPVDEVIQAIVDDLGIGIIP